MSESPRAAAAAQRAEAGAAGAALGGPRRPRVVAGLRLVRLVGHGGEGEVWEARTGNGDARALKLIRPDALVDPGEVERRGRWLRAVDHPALVAVRRTGVLAGGGLDGWAFVEMPFLDGPSLDDAPADPGAFERLAPLAEALDALHAGVWSGGMPLVHRDVKPANLIAVGEAVVLVDHSTLRDASAETVTRIGTPVFAAPEVPLGRAGPAADVYAFAATAVALSTGARGGALAALLDAPGELDVPAGVRAGLAVDPRDRPRSCQAVLAEGPPPALAAGHDAAEGSADAGGSRAPAADAAGEARRGTAVRDADATSGWGPLQVAGWSADEALSERWWAGEELEPAAPAPVWRWLAVLAALALAPLVAVALGRPVWPDVAAVVAGAAVLHLLAHVLAGGPGTLAVLAPPLAWAWLLGDRAAPTPRRRAYARAILAGALLGAGAAAGWGFAEGEEALPLAAGLVGLLVASAGVSVARHGSWGLQLLLLPVWALGAAVLAAGALILSPLALLVGWGGASLRLAWTTLAGVVETFRRPMAPPGGAR